MSVLGHVATGFAGGRAMATARPSRVVLAMVGLAAISVLPDADLFVPRMLGLDASGPFGHRGATHSLAFALVSGALAGLLGARIFHRGLSPSLLIGIAVAMSHPILDWLSDTNLGVALLWPFSDERFLAPWRVLPQPPLPRRLASPQSWALLLVEAVVFAPLWWYALRRGRKG